MELNSVFLNPTGQTFFLASEFGSESLAG